jgi:hypothetical protein
MGYRIIVNNLQFIDYGLQFYLFRLVNSFPYFILGTGQGLINGLIEP